MKKEVWQALAPCLVLAFQSPLWLLTFLVGFFHFVAAGERRFKGEKCDGLDSSLRWAAEGTGLEIWSWEPHNTWGVPALLLSSWVALGTLVTLFLHVKWG